MFDPESLFAPIVPPAGADDESPVLPVTHERLVTSLRYLSSMFEVMAKTAQDLPWADALFDNLDLHAGQALRDANAAVTAFRTTRDCRGRG